ncbi:TPA: hypothetical protein ACH3X2_013054 [Trebouxia sp. C0005]
MRDFFSLLCSVPLHHYTVKHTVLASATVIRVCSVYPTLALVQFAGKLIARQATSRIGYLMQQTVQSGGDISLMSSFRPCHALLHFILPHSSTDVHSKIEMNLEHHSYHKCCMPKLRTVQHGTCQLDQKTHLLMWAPHSF